MNISRLNMHGTHTGAAGQVQRNARVAKPTQLETVQPAAEDATPVKDVPTEPTKGVTHPRLAAYAEKIDKRLTAAMNAKDITPRQKAALQEAQDHFHGMVQRLDAAYTPANMTADKKVTQTMAQGLDMLMDHVAGVVNHIQSGGENVDVKG